jgi:2-haloacid dehalogenase
VSKVKALVFDVFGTVVDWRTGVAREFAAFLPAMGRTDLDPFALADQWRGLYQPGMEECRSGRRPYTRLDVLHRESLEKVLAAHNITGASEGDLDHLNRAWHRLDPWPEVVLGLTRMSRKYFLGTLSNGNFALMANLAKRAGLAGDAGRREDGLRVSLRRPRTPRAIPGRGVRGASPRASPARG